VLRLRELDHKFEVSLACIVRPCLKKQNNNNELVQIAKSGI
jgi:hypothetical protein